MIQRSLSLSAAVALLVFSGWVHGLWTDRWEDSASLTQAVARVGQVALTVGDWKGQALGPPDVDPAAFAQAGALGYWMRNYVNQRDGSEVTAILMCGQRSRMAVHTPEVCYRAAGYELVEAAAPCLIKPAGSTSAPAEFRTTLFATPDSGPQARRLRIFWSWNAGSAWQAPSGDARWTFRGAPFLYKLYVVHEVAGPSVPPDQDAGAALLRLLVPELQRGLVPSEKH